MKDWIRDDNAYVGVDEFKRITKVVKVTDKQNAQPHENPEHLSQLNQLFYLVESYNRATRKEKAILFNSIKRSFKQNPTLLNALFLSMVEVTNAKNKDKLAVHSNLMSAVDLSQADSDLLEIKKLFEVLNAQKQEKSQLEEKIKLYQVENSKYKKVVSELTTQINALKNIDQSIFARELVLDNQE